MTTELTWLMMTAILAASLWVPFVVGINTSPKKAPSTPDNFVIPPDPLLERPWVARSYRAHQNLLEAFAPFATIVLVGHAADVSTPVTVWCTIIFFWLRVAHAIGMITSWARMPARPLIFTAGWVTTIVFASQVFANSQ